MADSNMLAEPRIATIVLKKKRLHRRWKHGSMDAGTDTGSPEYGLQPCLFNRRCCSRSAQDQVQIYREMSTE